MPPILPLHFPWKNASRICHILPLGLGTASESLSTLSKAPKVQKFTTIVFNVETEDGNRRKDLGP